MKFKEARRPELLRLYRMMMQQIGIFRRVTNPWDSLLHARLTKGTRDKFKAMKLEQRPPKVLKFMKA